MSIDDRYGVPFQIFYGVSDNARTFWSITNAREVIGYAPEDDSEVRFADDIATMPARGLSRSGRSTAVPGHVVGHDKGAEGSSITTSDGFLSGRQPRQTGCRSRPAEVSSPYFTSPTREGVTQCASRASSRGTSTSGLV